MKEIWLEDPEERPNFRAIVISLAGLMNYKGNNERELKLETANCRKEHPYQKVQIPAAQQYTKTKNTDHVYSVLEEPIYGNYSREESLDPPEEYEVPKTSLQDQELRNSPPVLYEVPELGQDPEMGTIDASPSPPVHYEVPDLSVPSRSPSPPHYEVPEVAASGSASPPIHYEVPEFAASASYGSQSSVPLEYRMPESGVLMANGSLSSVPLDYEVPQSTPERKALPRRARTTTDKTAQRKPEAPPRRSPARQHNMKKASSPVRIPRTEPEVPPRRSRSPARQNEIKKAPSPARNHHKTVGDNEPYGMMTFEKNSSSSSKAEDPKRYLKLSYPTASASAPNSQEDHDMPPHQIGYSSLEWKKGMMVSNHSSNFNSLPSKFSLQNHVYQTLEPNGASVEL